ncbi:hypothetical protein MNV49_003428 [Pseudohyphozyma bogoriensis]|nr:hypothetical protein MNV49_003428 [Pseudohyphozyma bogoriensis]
MSPTISHIGDFPPSYSNLPILEIHSRDDAERVPSGFLAKRWDYISYVGPAYVRPSEMFPLRSQGDVLADGLEDVLDRMRGRDAIVVLKEGLADGDERVRRFWDSVNIVPESDNEVAKAMEPEGQWRGRTPSVEEGQKVFWTYSTHMFGALLHFSLAGGFTSPSLSAVLNETGYLSSVSKEATRKRLLETTMFCIDVMKDLTVGSKGWQSAIRVRLLHAQVRRRIAMKMGRMGVYDTAATGVPINQSDLIAVLGAFMVAPMWSMKKLGVPFTEFEAACYQKAWRHVGYYLGIEPVLLDKYYVGPFSTASQTFACFAFDAFPTDRPTDPYTTSTYRMLTAVALRPPLKTPPSYHCQYARKLLGPQLADHLAIPGGTWWDWLTLEAGLVGLLALVRFGKIWRSGWEKERVYLGARTVEMVVLQQLGERRSVYSERTEGKMAEMLTDKDGEEPVSLIQLDSKG